MVSSNENKVSWFASFALLFFISTVPYFFEMDKDILLVILGVPYLVIILYDNIITL